MGVRTSVKPLILVLSLDSEVLGIIHKCEELGFRATGFDSPQDFLAALKSQKPQLSILFVTESQKKIMLAMVQGIRNVLGKELILIGVVGKKDKALTQDLLTKGLNQVIERPLSLSKLATTIGPFVMTPKIQKVLETFAKEPQFKFKTPEILDWFFQKFSPALAGLSSVLENLEDVELQYQFYSQRLASYAVAFTTMVNSQRKSETKLDLMQSIRAYGVNQSRRLVVALKLSEATTGNLISWNDKTGALSGDPKAIIPFAVKSVEHFGEDSHMREVAFNNGLVYDLLFVLSEHAGNKKSIIRKDLERSFDANIKKADEYFKKAKAEKSLKLAQHSFTLLMMRDAGKFAMSIFYPDFIDVISWYDKKSIKSPLQHITEFEKYNISHNLMGALIAQSTPGLTEAYPVVLFHPYAFMLRGSKSEKDVFELIQFTLR